jgi:hypothetical protein
MNSIALACLTVLCEFLFLGSGNAANAATYKWTWSGAVFNGSGTLKTGGSCGGACEVIASINGTIARTHIGTISAPDTYPSVQEQGNDNKLFPSEFVFLDEFGLAFTLVSASEANISCYAAIPLCYLYIRRSGGPTKSDPGTFTILSHTPPSHHSSVSPLHSGLGVIGLLGWSVRPGSGLTIQ